MRSALAALLFCLAAPCAFAQNAADPYAMNTAAFLTYCRATPQPCASFIREVHISMMRADFAGDVVYKSCPPESLRNEEMRSDVWAWVDSHKNASGQAALTDVTDALQALYPCR